MIRHDKAGSVTTWWHALQPDPAHGRPGDRAALARLRRCASVVEAMNEPATIALFRACEASHPDDLVRIGLAAAVLAHLRKDEPGQTVARRVGPQDGPDSTATALLKPLRFQRLMTAAAPDERLAAMRRLVALAGGTLNLRDLSEALLFWTDERRRRWTYDYWGVGQPATRPNRPTPDKDPAA